MTEKNNNIIIKQGYKKTMQ